MANMSAVDILFVAISYNISFMGKTWWMLMVVLRLFLVLLAGFTLFSDDQERFVCNTIQPGCSNVCFDLFAPVSLFRLWLFHIVLLCLPHLMFATHIAHKVFTVNNFGPDAPVTTGSSGETPLAKAPPRDLSRGWWVPSFHCGYLWVVILRILLETAFAAGQYFLFGFFIPRSFLCYEAPCVSGVECYVSRPTEKTLMLDSMLGLAGLSVLLSMSDLLSSVRRAVRWRKRRDRLMEEVSKGEQGSVFSTASAGGDTDPLLSKRNVPDGSVKNGKEDGTPAAEPFPRPNHGTGDGSLGRAGAPRAAKPVSTPVSTPVPGQFVLRSHLRPPASPRTARGPSPGTPVGAGTQGHPAGPGFGQNSDSSDAADKRAWV